MGEPWRTSSAWHVVERAEAALGQPLAYLLLDDSSEVLARTRDAQLAVLLASLLAWEAVRHRLDGQPVAFAGHSLGQITALIASGALSLDDGVRLAAARADATQAAADARPGRMAALIGTDLARAEAACAGVEAWVANDNAPGQVVIGGTPEGLEAALHEARRLGVRRSIPLNVGAAFHTPLMDSAAAALTPHLEATLFGAPTAPVVSNVDAQPYTGADGWPGRLATQLVAPVRWRPSMETMAAMGADVFLEIGRGAVLAGLARRTVPTVTTRGIAVPDDALLEVA